MARLSSRHHVTTLGGGAETLVFGHGLGTDQSIWRLVAPRLAADHRVVLLDWVGCGAADPAAYDSGRYASLRGHAADLCALVAELDSGPVTYVGHSAGGMIGILGAIAEPTRFARVVALASSPRYLDDPPDYVGGFRPTDLEALFALMDDNFLGWSATFAAIAAKDPVVEGELVTLFRNNNRGHLREFAESILRSDFRADLPKLDVPALIVGSTQDDMVPVAASEYLHENLRGSGYVCLDIAGHCPQMTHPREVETLIRSFLAGKLG